MKTTFIPTNEIYRDVVAAPNMAVRRQRYHTGFIDPCQTMFQSFLQWQGGDDLLAVARQWHYLMPESLTELPAVLLQLEAAQAWQRARKALTIGASRLAPLSALTEVTGWLMLQDAAQTDSWARGSAGAIDFITGKHFFILYDTPTERNIRSLPGAVVHELNHLVRFKAIPWQMHTTTVADYIVVEGVAESFAAACFGDEVLGHYVTEFNKAALEQAKQLIAANLETTGFNVIRGFIFGDALADKHGFEAVGGMPAFGGYAIGYHVVQAYLQKSGRSIEEATFTDAQTIVRESGYFA